MNNKTKGGLLLAAAFIPAHLLGFLICRFMTPVKYYPASVLWKFIFKLDIYFVLMVILISAITYCCVQGRKLWRQK